jgi:hypothetical protein
MFVRIASFPAISSHFQYFFQILPRSILLSFCPLPAKRFQRSGLVNSVSHLSLQATMGNGKSQPLYPSSYRSRRGEANRRGQAPTTFAQQSPSDDPQVQPCSRAGSGLSSATGASSMPGQQDSPRSQSSDTSSSSGTPETKSTFLHPLNLFSTYPSALNSPQASAAQSLPRPSQALTPTTSRQGAPPLSQTSQSTSNLASSARRAQAPTTTQERRSYRRQHSAPVTEARTAIAIPPRALPATWNWETAHTGSTTTPAGSTSERSTPERSTYPLSAPSPIATAERLGRAATLTSRSIFRTSNQPPTHTAEGRDRAATSSATPPCPLEPTSSQNAARRAPSRATALEHQLGILPVSLPIGITRRFRNDSEHRTSHTPYNTPESR